jgi:hypothetical protein
MSMFRYFKPNIQYKWKSGWNLNFILLHITRQPAWYIFPSDGTRLWNLFQLHNTTLSGMQLAAKCQGMKTKQYYCIAYWMSGQGSEKICIIRAVKPTEGKSILLHSRTVLFPNRQSWVTHDSHNTQINSELTRVRYAMDPHGTCI